MIIDSTEPKCNSIYSTCSHAGKSNFHRFTLLKGFVIESFCNIDLFGNSAMIFCRLVCSTDGVLVVGDSDPFGFTGDKI